VNKFYRVTGTAIAALTLAASAAAFSTPLAAAQATTHGARSSPAGSPFPHPMIPAQLPAGAAADAIGNVRTVGSANWAGYAVQRSGVKFKAIKATFFVPFLNCAVTPGNTPPGDFSSHWVGLDGFGSTTVEQDGIEADCSGGSASYHAWREVYPRPEQPFSMTIRPGDSITASVKFSKSSGKYRMEVRDNTRGTHDTARQRCTGSSCKRSSAEVISEAPTVGGSLAALADYGALSYAGISIKGAGRTGGIKSSHWSRVKIVQVDSGHNILAIPTALNGRSFDVYWLREN
jgi:hypothetical protein